MKRSSAILAMTVALALGSLLSRAQFINNSVQVPVDRVVTNVQAWIKDKPTDPQGYYVLGRIHAMAWAYGPDLNLWGAMGAGGRVGRRGAGGAAGGPATAAGDPFNGQLPGFAPYDSVEVRRQDEKAKVTADDAKHLEESIKAYSKAVELDNKNAVCQLGLAWILQETGKVAGQLPDTFLDTTDAKPSDAQKASFDAAIKKLADADPKTRDDATKSLAAAMPESYAALRAVKSDDAEVTARVANLLQGYWDLKALEHYRAAYSLNVQKDLNSGGLKTGDSRISAEAGEAILEILKSQPDAARKDEAGEVAANVQKVNDRPMAVTPVIFAMPGATPQPANVADLVDPMATTKFDLAGDGVARQWPWLKPGTALLVWDPALTGNITSGRALFGSRTWWIFFRNGYEALSVLDDNRDGRLTGSELQGIAVWIDKNGDGISQPGEVTTLAQAGITEIGVSQTADADGTLTSSRGVVFSDGRTAKTFDWITQPIESGSAEKH